VRTGFLATRHLWTQVVLLHTKYTTSLLPISERPASSPDHAVALWESARVGNGLRERASLPGDVTIQALGDALTNSRQDIPSNFGASVASAVVRHQPDDNHGRDHNQGRPKRGPGEGQGRASHDPEKNRLPRPQP
jgi:hypothetical protein